MLAFKVMVMKRRRCLMWSLLVSSILLNLIAFGCSGTSTSLSYSSASTASWDGEGGIITVITTSADDHDSNDATSKEAPTFVKQLDPDSFEAKQVDVIEDGKSARRAIAFVSMGEWHVWWFPALPGHTYRVRLSTLSGDADLFVFYPEGAIWLPGVGITPWLWSTNPGALVDSITFRTGFSYPYTYGIYQKRFVVVFGYLPSMYRLTIIARF